MVGSVGIVDGLATRWSAQARAITFEYVALTQREAGLPAPQDIGDLPEPLRAVLDSLAERHGPPGALLLAVHGDTVCGTVALQARPRGQSVQAQRLTAGTDAVVQRLYVREEIRAACGANHQAQIRPSEHRSERQRARSAARRIRRRGMARELMAAVQAMAAREGFHRLVLNVMTSRAGALAFYRALATRRSPSRSTGRTAVSG